MKHSTCITDVAVAGLNPGWDQAPRQIVHSFLHVALRNTYYKYLGQ